MTFGSDYARAYDAFYRTKDYLAEARFVNQYLKNVNGGSNLRILDLGCGTGLHDVELAKMGHSVVGCDVSQDMLAIARERRESLPSPLKERLSFENGDARSLRLGATFGAVVSLFHVMSYMAGEGDFEAALATARAHLNPGGVFFFDFWYGPAVLADPPRERERLVEEAGKHIRRKTLPLWDREHDVVRIIFDVEQTDGSGGPPARVREEHKMRFFFEDALARSIRASGFELGEMGEWLTGKPASKKTFGVYAVAKAI